MTTDTSLAAYNLSLPRRRQFVAASSLVDFSHEQRKEPRTPLIAPCSVVPIDLKFMPNGKPFAAVTTDISQNGIGILHTEAIEPQLLLITITQNPGQSFQLIGDIVHCGCINDFYKIGMKLIQRVDPSDSPFQW